MFAEDNKILDFYNIRWMVGIFFFDMGKYLYFYEGLLIELCLVFNYL